MADLYPMLSVEEAAEKFLSHFAPLEVETVPILEALGRVLAETVTAPMDVPPLSNTAMDGYAVRSEDVASARPEAPVRLQIAADLAAGYVREQPVQPGTAVRIMTGAPIPPGADAVIPFEDVQVQNGQVIVSRPISPGKNVRQAGEDVRKGQVVLEPGAVLKPAAIGMLAALGHATVRVHRRPRVAILSTGDEVIDIDAPWQPGKIRDANSYSNAAQVLKYGGIPIRLGIARDTVEDLTAKIRAGLEQKVDLFLTSGGVSVGDFDVVKKVLAAEGEIAFWRVRMKPGKPLAFGLIQGVPILGLPGNPVSAMVSFEMFARPAILRMLGYRDLARPTVEAVLLDSIPRKDNRRHYVRVTLSRGGDGDLYARLTGDQGSGILLSMVKADGLAVIPEDVDHLDAGSKVKVIPLD
ncbi:MAG: molybdopterin molybdotransferase MoeA [Anaerolineae bacterium]